MWWKQKTTWTGIVAVIGGVGGYLTGSISPIEAIGAVWAGIAIIFGRQAVAKVGQ